jgi:flagellar basal-body rod protein FlgB
MDYAQLPLFQMLQGKMSYTSARQDQLAKNVAHLDVPGYQPMDIAEPNFAQMAMQSSQRLTMATTSATHMLPNQGDSGKFGAKALRQTYAITPMENGSVLEEQMMKIAENQMQFQQATNLYSKMVKLFKTAIGN